MPTPERERQTITGAEVGALDPSSLEEGKKAATEEEAAASDPHYRPQLIATIEQLQNLIPQVEVEIDIPDPAADPTENKTIKEKRMVPGYIFERIPSVKNGNITVALVERDGGDRISGKGKTTAEAVSALVGKMREQGRLPR